MTIREAFIQAQLEMGVGREEVFLKIKASEAALPEAVGLELYPVKPGLEREFIDFLKDYFRKIDANPSLRNYINDQVLNRAKTN
jgi:hypothetical protein